jgi:hypothetical protein
MDRTPINLSASSKAALIDGDITHIARVMRLSLQGDLAGPILAPAYWRERLYKLLDTAASRTRSSAQSTASCSNSTSSRPSRPSRGTNSRPRPRRSFRRRTKPARGTPSSRRFIALASRGPA